MGNGFGFSTNTTYIDSVSEASSFSNDQLPLPGISTYNLNVIAFYENRHIGIRLGYNQRSKYLSPFSKTIRISDFTMFNNQLGVPLALYHNGSKRLDARIFWHLDHRFSLHIDMLNITKESESGYLEFKDIPAFYKQDESRLAFGLKVNAF